MIRRVKDYPDVEYAFPLQLTHFPPFPPDVPGVSTGDRLYFGLKIQVGNKTLWQTWREVEDLFVLNPKNEVERELFRRCGEGLSLCSYALTPDVQRTDSFREVAATIETEPVPLAAGREDPRFYVYYRNAVWSSMKLLSPEQWKLLVDKKLAAENKEIERLSSP